MLRIFLRYDYANVPKQNVYTYLQMKFIYVKKVDYSDGLIKRIIKNEFHKHLIIRVFAETCICNNPRHIYKYVSIRIYQLKMTVLRIIGYVLMGIFILYFIIKWFLKLKAEAN
jgi:hypothetical protein